MLDMNMVVGKTNILFVTLDCLRFDVAQRCLLARRTPLLASHLPNSGWEPRETPGTFTLAAHLAFFHGFLPTPLTRGPHVRLFALDFEGSLTIGPETLVFRNVDNIITGFHQNGYRSFCVGGVGFFNKKNPMGCVLPGFFQESVWTPEMGVTGRDSTRVQVQAAVDWLSRLSKQHKVLLFINISATHPPHYFFVPGAKEDSVHPGDSQAAALSYVDGCLEPLFASLALRGDCFCLFMADHGEAHGEDGRFGHRIAHPTVTTVPYAHFFLR